MDLTPLAGPPSCPSFAHPFDEHTPDEVIIAHARRKIRESGSGFEPQESRARRAILAELPARITHRTWAAEPWPGENPWLRFTAAVEFYDREEDVPELNAASENRRGAVCLHGAGCPPPSYAAMASFDGSGGGSLHLVALHRHGTP